MTIQSIIRNGALSLILFSSNLAALEYFWFSEDHRAGTEALIDIYHSSLEEEKNYRSELNSLKNSESSGAGERQVDLQWKPDPVAVAYVVLIKNNAGDEVFKEKTKNNYLSAKLEPGSYTLQVAGVGASGLQGEFSDPAPISVKDQISGEPRLAEKIKSLEESRRQAGNDAGRALSALRKSSVLTGTSMKGPEQQSENLLRYPFSEERFGSPTLVRASIRGQDRSTTSINKSEQARHYGFNKAGLIPFISFPDSAISGFNPGWGGALHLQMDSVFFKWLNPVAEISYVEFAANNAPLRTLDHTRVFAGMLASYPLLKSVPLYATFQLGGGLMFISFLNDTDSRNYLAAFLSAVPGVSYYVWKGLSIDLQLATTYHFDTGQNLLYLEPRLGVSYQF